jgi:hypothetical protein
LFSSKNLDLKLSYQNSPQKTVTDDFPVQCKTKEKQNLSTNITKVQTKNKTIIREQ